MADARLSTLNNGVENNLLLGSDFVGSDGLGTANTSTLTLSLPIATSATSWSNMPHFVAPIESPIMIDVQANLAAAIYDTQSFFPIAIRDSEATPNILLFVQAEGTGIMTIYDQSGLKGLAYGVFSFTGNDWVRMVILDDGGALVYHGSGTYNSITWDLIWAGQIVFPGNVEDYSNLTFNQYQGAGSLAEVSVQWDYVSVNHLD